MGFNLAKPIDCSFDQTTGEVLSVALRETEQRQTKRTTIINTHADLWIKEASGKETHVTVSTMQENPRQGQTITLLDATLRQGGIHKQIPTCALVNLSSRNYAILNDGFGGSGVTLNTVQSLLLLAMWVARGFFWLSIIVLPFTVFGNSGRDRGIGILLALAAIALFFLVSRFLKSICGEDALDKAHSEVVGVMEAKCKEVLAK